MACRCSSGNYLFFWMRCTRACTLLLFFFLLLALRSTAQVGVAPPFGLAERFYKDLPALILPPVDQLVIQRLKEQDQKFVSTIAYNFKTAFTPDNSGEWITYSQNFQTWVLKLRTEEAIGIALVLSEVNLLPGEKLFVYNRRGMHGSFDQDHTPASGIIPLDYLPGDEIVIEFDVPSDHPVKGNFVIGTVSHAFKNIFESEAFAIPGKDTERLNQGECQGCLEGTFWQQNKRSVVKMSIFKDNGTIQCTGCLVNNTVEDAKPYILTAFHCIASQEDADRTIFTFNYEDQFCSGTAAFTGRSFTGSTFRAGLYENDFSLVELHHQVPIGLNPYFAGWDIGEQNPARVSCIHHPLGGVKKISVDNNTITTGDYIDESNPPRAPDAFWHIEKWDIGVTESGSSGAPLFNSDLRVIGTLTGGTATCGDPYHDYFEKLSESWAPSDHPGQQLKYWLDPLSTGSTLLDGFDPFEGESTVSCDTFSNISPHELTGLIPHPSGTGYLSGCNPDQILSYAEKFTLPDRAMLTGANVFAGSINTEAEGGIFVQVHSEVNGLPGPALYENYIPYERLSLFFNYLDFYPFVNVNSTFFISYSLTCSDDDTFALEQVDWRATPVNTAFLKSATGWFPITALHSEGLGSSLHIQPVLCSEVPPTSEPSDLKMDLYPNPATSYLIARIPLAEKEAVQLEIYDSVGCLLSVDFTVYDGTVFLDTSSLSCGTYVLRAVINRKVQAARFIKI